MHPIQWHLRSGSDFLGLGSESTKAGSRGTRPDCHPYIKVTINGSDAPDRFELFGMIVSSCGGTLGPTMIANMHPIKWKKSAKTISSRRPIPRCPLKYVVEGYCSPSNISLKWHKKGGKERGDAKCVLIRHDTLLWGERYQVTVLVGVGAGLHGWASSLQPDHVSAGDGTWATKIRARSSMWMAGITCWWQRSRRGHQCRMDLDEGDSDGLWATKIQAVGMARGWR
jgi:hypothetical protein